jgi:hypothetical protein
MHPQESTWELRKESRTVLDYDELAVFLVDEKGNQLDKYGPVQWSGPLREGQTLRLALEGREKLYRVLGIRSGEGRGRFVKVVEVEVTGPQESQDSVIAFGFRGSGHRT